MASGTQDNFIPPDIKTHEVPLFNQSIFIPDDLPRYIDICHRFSRKAQETTAIMDSLARKNVGAETICDELWKHTRSDIEECIVELSQYGLYNITASDFLSDKHYTISLDWYSNRLNGSLSSLEAHRSQALAAAEDAADSIVTGLPFDIYTSSPIGLTVYALQQNAEIKNQQHKAKMEYIVQSSDINKTYNSMASDAAKESFGEFIRRATHDIQSAYETIKDKYVQKLSSIHIISTHFLKNYSEKRSTALLDNLKAVPDKKRVLEESIVLCPYNPQIYSEAGLNNLLESCLIDLIHDLHIEEEVCRAIEVQNKLPDTSETLPSIIYDIHGAAFNAIALLSGQSASVIAHRYYPTLKSNIVDSFKKLANIIADPDVLLHPDTLSKIQKFALNNYMYTQDPMQFVKDFTRSPEHQIQTMITHFDEGQIVNDIAAVIEYPISDSNLEYCAILNYLAKKFAPILSHTMDQLNKQNAENVELKRIQKGAQENRTEIINTLKKIWIVSVIIDAAIFFLCCLSGSREAGPYIKISMAYLVINIIAFCGIMFFYTTRK